MAGSDAPDLIPWCSGRFLLGHAGMDETHDVFANLVNRLALADDAEFAALFRHLLAHTERHFTAEEALMAASGCSTLDEHRDEHRRLLGELRRLQRQVSAGRRAVARLYLHERLGECGDHGQRPGRPSPTPRRLIRAARRLGGEAFFPTFCHNPACHIPAVFMRYPARTVADLPDSYKTRCYAECRGASPGCRGFSAMV